MKTHVLVTTTNTFEGKEILAYISIVSTNVVIGTNFFSDFGASFTDFFGGYSNTYQNKLQGIYKTAIKNLQEQASEIGGNAIVGLKIDFDEISGKGKSMFMVSALGMVVKLKISEDPEAHNEQNGIISNDELQNEISKLHIKYAIEKDIRLNNEQWSFLLRFPFPDIMDGLLAQFYRINIGFLKEGEQNILDNIEKYLSLLDSKIVINILYSKILDEPNDTILLLNKLKLFSPQKILELIKENQELAIECLKIDKDFYTESDLKEMIMIINYIDQLPNIGKIEAVSGFISKGKDKFICVCTNKNDINIEFCSVCGKNIKGLTLREVNWINAFREKVKVLSELLKK